MIRAPVIILETVLILAIGASSLFFISIRQNARETIPAVSEPPPTESAASRPVIRDRVSVALDPHGPDRSHTPKFPFRSNLHSRHSSRGTKFLLVPRILVAEKEILS